MLELLEMELTMNNQVLIGHQEKPKDPKCQYPKVQKKYYIFLPKVSFVRLVYVLVHIVLMQYLFQNGLSIIIVITRNNITAS